jgi:hypothetical protein
VFLQPQVGNQLIGHLMKQVRAHRSTKAGRKFARHRHASKSIAGLH